MRVCLLYGRLLPECAPEGKRRHREVSLLVAPSTKEEEIELDGHCCPHLHTPCFVASPIDLSDAESAEKQEGWVLNLLDYALTRKTTFEGPRYLGVVNVDQRYFLPGESLWVDKGAVLRSLFQRLQGACTPFQVIRNWEAVLREVEYLELDDGDDSGIDISESADLG